MRARVAVLDGHLKKAFFAPLVRAFEADWRQVAAPSALASSVDADLVLVNDETWPHHAATLPELERHGIPSLHLVDGILEWRNTWETPRPQAFLQPVLASKIACLGAAQARVLDAWGNAGKCEVTGSHRFDHLIGRRPRARDGRWRLLIATARQPDLGGAAVRDAMRRALADIKAWAARHPSVEAIWRLTSDIDRELGVSNTLATPLGDQLASVDAVVTTPSTLMLEAMLCDLPVALLDYTNRPQYVPAAWSIHATAHLDEILADLERPSAERMRHQRLILQDNLACGSPAAPRIAAVMQRLIAIGREARAHGHPLELPRSILESPPSQPLPPMAAVDRRALEAEISHLRAVLRRRPTEIAYRALCELRRLLG